jgi:hypothetical protein
MSFQSVASLREVADLGAVLVIGIAKVLSELPVTVPFYGKAKLGHYKRKRTNN